MSSQDSCCKTCGNNALKLCSICGREYAGLSKLHLRTSIHKLYKTLFKFLRQAPESEIQRLCDAYIPKAELPSKTISKQTEISTQTEDVKQKHKKVSPKKQSSSSKDEKPKKILKKKSKNT